MKYRVFLSAFFFVLLPSLGKAEYRVFLLKISKRAPANTPAPPPGTPPPAQDFRLVESTLDHIQYRYYHQVAPDEDVTYIDTWRCYGRTGDFKHHCPNPKGQIPAEESPAS
nr:hypothetical protein HAGR004_27400 [Bdellovibrio sp. HAGR004]